MPNQRIIDSLMTMGENVRLARLRQDVTINELATRAGLARTTIIRIEQGAPGVAISAWASVLDQLDLLGSFAASVEASRDLAGLAKRDSELPARASATKRRTRRR
jgi:transcriptional regulator with XRE-family HTH domain